MSYEVRNYRLPAGSRRSDVLTLIVWKAWDGWLRPVMVLTVIFSIGQCMVAWFSGNGEALHYLIKWGPQPRPPLVTFTPQPWALWWSIGAEVLAVLVGALLGFVALRRHRSPLRVAILAGLGAVALHLTFAQLWTSHPLGAIGTPSIAMLTSRELFVYPATPVQQVLAVCALWSPIVVGPLVAWGLDRLNVPSRRFPSTSSRRASP